MMERDKYDGWVRGQTFSPRQESTLPSATKLLTALTMPWKPRNHFMSNTNTQ